MSYRYVLVPGRHHCVTAFQIDHMSRLLAHPDVDADAEAVWAITSANHSGTRRNPLPGARRMGMIESVTATASVPALAYQINNMTPKPHFAHFLIEEIRLESKGRVVLTPENTLVMCSTACVAAQYRELGFTIDPGEADDSFTNFHAPLPWDVVEAMVASGRQWRTAEAVRGALHPACLAYYERYGLGDDIVDIFQDPLIGSSDGDITTTRDYATYRQAFEDGAARKVADFERFVRPGRVLDVGCATGETIKLLSRSPALFESDF